MKRMWGYMFGISIGLHAANAGIASATDTQRTVAEAQAKCLDCVFSIADWFVEPEMCTDPSALGYLNSCKDICGTALTDCDHGTLLMFKRLAEICGVRPGDSAVIARCTPISSTSFGVPTYLGNDRGDLGNYGSGGSPP